MSYYYDRDGQPITSDRWSELYEDRDYQVLEQTMAGHYLVSTVWLGLDHSYFGKPPPLIFETMVFDRSGERPFHDLDMERYATEAQARCGHQRMVGKVRQWHASV